MQFRVYGVDAISKEPRAFLLVEADGEEAARAWAREQGMQVEGVEPVRPEPTAPPIPNTEPTADPVTSGEQLRALGRLAGRVGGRLRRVVESFGFRLFVIGCLAVILMLAIRVHSRLDELRPPRQGQEGRWEYKVVDAPDTRSSLTDAVNEANRQGWEVVGVVSSVESVFERVRTRVMLILKFPTDCGQWESGVSSHTQETHRWQTNVRSTPRSSNSRP